MKKNRPLITLISVFFFWGFVAASNTVLIGLFKKNFELSQFQSQLVDFAFYAAYAIGSLIYLRISSTKGDPLNRIGYKKGLITGLTISAIGALGFIPAGFFGSFPLMLISLFTIGLGFALQQIVANPYVIALGDPSTGAHRNMLAGGVNSFGTTIGPLLLAYAIYGNVSGTDPGFFVSGSQRIPVELTIERTSNKTETLIAPLNAAATAGEIVYTGSGNIPEILNVYATLAGIQAKGILLIGQEKEKISDIVKSIKKKYPRERVPIFSADKKYSSSILSEGGYTITKAEVGLLGVDAVILPSLVLAIAFLLFAFLLWRSELPQITNSEKIEAGFGALKFPQLVYGMVAIFVYVGVEVAIQSNMPELMRQEFHREPGTTVHFISLYWGGLMIGRFVGALTIFNLNRRMRMLMTIVLPFIVYAVVLASNYIKISGKVALPGEIDPMRELLNFTPFVIILIAGFFLASEKPARTMVLFGSLGALMLLAGLLISSEWSVYFFLSGGLFCSVMWPCIFSLSIAGLGKYTTQGSSLLIMMILGGALIPPLQGFVGDATGTMKVSYVIPLAGFLYLAFYGWKVNSVLKKQGINYDTNVAAH